MKKAKDKYKKYAILVVAVVIIGLLLSASLIFSEGIDIVEGVKFIRSETVYIVVALAILLPVMLLRMFFILIRKKKVVVKKTELVPTIPEITMPAQVEQKEEAKEEKEEEEEKAEREPRFFMLNRTDEEMRLNPPKEYKSDITLGELCTQFRNFAANKLKLYYDEADIRQFISGLAVTHIVVMQGMSGTGKTSLAYAFGEFLQNKSTIVPIQPMWKERTDLIGYYNEFTKKFNETALLQKMYEANYNDEMYVTVLDEMNIARVEYYFAEFLSLLEIPNPEGRYLDVVSDKWDTDPVLLKDGRIKLPPNMWFIGTANNDDSTFAISDKVYDRAMVMNLDKKSKPFEAPKTEPIKLSAKHWEKMVQNAQSEFEITERNLRRIARLDGYMIEHFHLTFGNRIMKQIRCYVPVVLACGGTELEAIDDILAKKVLRKLEAQNPIYVRNSAEGLRNYLDELFGTDKMPKCKEYLFHLERTA